MVWTFLKALQTVCSESSNHRWARLLNSKRRLPFILADQEKQTSVFRIYKYTVYILQWEEIIDSYRYIINRRGGVLDLGASIAMSS